MSRRCIAPAEVMRPANCETGGAARRTPSLYLGGCLLPVAFAIVTSVARAAAPDAIVAADGTGQYRSIQEAISVAPHRTNTEPRWTIFIKAGTYRERVYVQRERGYITLIGEDAARTTLVYDQHANLTGPDGKPIGTFRTPTLQIDGDGFEIQNLTIANDAGPVGQALALRADGDRLAFRRCRFLGWQDTILTNRGRHYFEDCYIEGHVDFIFGGATVFFSRCHIHCLRNGYITAASTPEVAAHGYVFADGRISGAEDVKTYLGRPWRPFARTVFLRTEMSDVVRPTGWDNWNNPEAERTTFYAEFGSTGPGANDSARVAWAKPVTAGEAAALTPVAVLGGVDGWNPADGPTLHLVGDSTMADKPDLDYPERGWGQLFRELVRSPLRLVNHAVNGRSTKSFRDEGRWARVLNQLTPGDWVVVQFGHNDEKSDDPTRFAHYETDYPANLTRFVREVRERGASPVLATPVVRRLWDEHGVLRDSHGPYLVALRRVAMTENVPLLKLEGATRTLETRLGPEGSKQLHLIFAPGEHHRLPEGKEDNTHYSETGARLVAALAAAEMRRNQLPFVTHLDASDSHLALTPWIADRGDGTYQNPILHADWSDPDAVRVGDDYWMVASSFSHVPGLPLLHSRDLVNWTLENHALPRLVPEDVFTTPQHGKGVWAPAIRHHDGKFWIYYPDPDFGLYVTTATDPRGAWSPPVLVKGGKGLIDPCPLWTDDGRVYLVHAWAKSRAGINNVLTLLRLSDDGLRVEEDLGVIIDGHKLPNYTTLEGPKLYHRNGWFYVFAPAGGVKQGWQSVFRARDIRGPYADRIVLAQGNTPINGPHQGALVDTTSGESWFVHFQDKDAYGRIVHLQPVTWHGDWPVIGLDADGDGRGEPALTHAKPVLPIQRIASPPVSDDFDGPALGRQWQWQANPAVDWISCTAQPGSLRLFGQPAAAPNLWSAPHLLLQKFPGLEFTGTTRVSVARGARAGLVIFGSDYAWLGVENGRVVFKRCAKANEGAPESETAATPLAGNTVELRVTVSAGARCRFFWSSDGGAFSRLGDEFVAQPGRWVGAKIGLFCERLGEASAYADFAWFKLTR